MFGIALKSLPKTSMMTILTSVKFQSQNLLHKERLYSGCGLIKIFEDADVEISIYMYISPQSL